MCHLVNVCVGARSNDVTLLAPQQEDDDDGGAIEDFQRFKSIKSKHVMGNGEEDDEDEDEEDVRNGGRGGAYNSRYIVLTLTVVLKIIDCIRHRRCD